MPMIRLPVGQDVAMDLNEWGQPVGAAVPGRMSRPRPAVPVLTGRYCRLERLDPDRHGAQLFAADVGDERGESWTYLPYGPFADLVAYRQWIDQTCGGDDPLFYAIIDTDTVNNPGHERAVGVLSYVRIQPDAASIEVGHVHYSPLLQRRRAATEAQQLAMSYAFEGLGYRRYEWKCDALNAASRAAAERLGFCYEGTFRQATVVKGRNRDTAWYAIIDTEWPTIRDGLTAWLAPDNFDEGGQQKKKLRPSGPAR